MRGAPLQLLRSFVLLNLHGCREDHVKISVEFPHIFWSSFEHPIQHQSEDSHAHRIGDIGPPQFTLPIELRMVGSHFEYTIQLLILNGHLYLSDVWLGKDLRMDTRKTCVQSRLDSVLKVC